VAVASDVMMTAAKMGMRRTTIQIISTAPPRDLACTAIVGQNSAPDA
jgi:hypothetical protein